MIRIVFWAALIYIAFWAWRRFKRAKQQPARPPAGDPTAPPMVRCANCGVHLLQTRALQQEGDWFCTQGHLEQGPRPRAR